MIKSSGLSKCLRLISIPVFHRLEARMEMLTRGKADFPRNLLAAGSWYENVRCLQLDPNSKTVPKSQHHSRPHNGCGLNAWRHTGVIKVFRLDSTKRIWVFTVWYRYQEMRSISIYQQYVCFLSTCNRDGIRTRNLRIRSPAPYPLGHTIYALVTTVQ